MNDDEACELAAPRRGMDGGIRFADGAATWAAAAIHLTGATARNSARENRLAADPGLFERFVGHRGQPLGQAVDERVDGDEIDRFGHGCFRPSIGKRVTVRMPDCPRSPSNCPSKAPSDVMTPMPVTTIGLPNLSRDAAALSLSVSAPPLLDGPDQGHACPASDGPNHYNRGGLDISTSRPVGSLGGNSAPRDSDSAASATPRGNWVSSVCPNDVPVARTAQPLCWFRNALSSDVTGSTPVAPVISAPLSPPTPSFDHSASSEFVTAPGCLRCARSATTLLSFA
jgi:hypothetical protein